MSNGAFAPDWFTTDEYPEEERLPVCRRRLSGLLATLDIEPSPGVPFQARTVSCELPDACLTTCFLTCARTCRNSSQCLRDGSDHIMLLRPVGGAFSVAQSGRVVHVAAGDAVLVSTSLPWSWDVSAVERLDCLRVPRSAMRSAPADLLSRLPRLVSHEVAAFQLLAHYGGALLQGILPIGTLESRRIAACHVQDLLGMLLTDGQDNQAPAPTRLDLVRRDIEINLADRDLTLESIARRQRVTPRTVQKLFEAEGTTFSEFVLEKRLAAAWDALRGDAKKKISDVAYEAGFGDLSYFNRAFRRKYGVTPRTARLPLP
jgi:AraC-like DNA-binding protein